MDDSLPVAYAVLALLLTVGLTLIHLRRSSSPPDDATETPADDESAGIPNPWGWG